MDFRAALAKREYKKKNLETSPCFNYKVPVPTPLDVPDCRICLPIVRFFRFDFAMPPAETPRGGWQRNRGGNVNFSSVL